MSSACANSRYKYLPPNCSKSSPRLKTSSIRLPPPFTFRQVPAPWPICLLSLRHCQKGVVPYNKSAFIPSPNGLQNASHPNKTPQPDFSLDQQGPRHPPSPLQSLLPRLPHPDRLVARPRFSSQRKQKPVTSNTRPHLSSHPAPLPSSLRLSPRWDSSPTLFSSFLHSYLFLFQIAL